MRGRDIVGAISTKLDYATFRTFCGAHQEEIVQQKWEEFMKGWPAVRYVLADAIDALYVDPEKP
jgi:hypothetical protein